MKNIKTIMELIAVFATVCVFADESAPFSLNTMKGTRITQGAEVIAYSTEWDKGDSVRVIADGTTIKEAVAPASGDVSWDGGSASLGCHTLSHICGDKTLTAKFIVLGDDVVVHSGVIAANEVWDSDKVHLVTAAVTVQGGVSLTINSGAVVKFMPETSLTVISGGNCIASGAIFTHVNDDTIGGDTLMDGDSIAPMMGEYTITGNVVDDDTTEYRYSAPQVLTSNISSDTRLRGYRTYIISNSVTVASGAKLTLQPGTILKLNNGCSLTINGTLDAKGTRAAPIIFTSLKDDEHGGDTNEDGDKTYAQGGDWYQIRVSGTADFNYCHVLYNSSTENYGGVEAYGGTINFDNSEIAHTKYECVNAHSSGNFTARNSVFRDSSLGFGYYGSGRVKAYNCVFSDLSVAIRQSGKILANCVFYRCLAFTDQSGDRSSFSNCVFFNDSGYGAQSYTKCGSNGNIWGDPKFVDADNGDFRISADSPCIDAGDGSVAPEADYYGQPRNGVADIGIYEATDGMTSQNDLAAENVVVDSTAIIGDEITVSWDVANVGLQNISGSWRDKIRLTNSSGSYGINLGRVVSVGSIETGGVMRCSAKLTVPPTAEGTWSVAVNINSERDIFEGSLTTNNIAISASTITITIPEIAAADGVSGDASSAVPAASKVIFSGAEAMIGRISAPEGTIVYFGNGFMPSSDAYTARVVVGKDGGIIGIPEGVKIGYFLVESLTDNSVKYSLTFESGALAIKSISPNSVPYSGVTGLILTGANFADGCTIKVWPNGQASSAISIDDVKVVSATQLSATLDCSKLKSGATYTVSVTDVDGNSTVLTSAFSVANVPPKAELKASLDVPDAVRQGRTITCWIDYENVGNIDMPAPIFELISTGQVFKVDGNIYTNSVKVMGLSAEAPVGTLRPGEPQRLGVTVTILSENVKWKLRSYHAAQKGAKKAKFSLRELYDEDWVLYHVAEDDATVANLRKAIGSTFAAYYTNLGAWLGTVEPQTTDYETLKSAFGKYQYLKASGMLDVGTEDSSTGDSPVQNMNAQAARSTNALRLLSDSKSGCNHKRLVGDWKTAGNGSVFKLCPSCKEWHQLVELVDGNGSKDWKDWYTILEKDVFDAKKKTYVICHGNKNSVEEKWIKNIGLAIMKRSSDAMILAVNWGEGAHRSSILTLWQLPLAYRSAGAIPEVADEASRQLAKLGVIPDNTMLIGHSHGGHVVANIACHYRDYGSGNKFNRLVGLDTSTTDNFIHKLWKKSNDIVPDLDKWYGAWTPSKWMGDIDDRCEQVEFYKSSWDMSVEETTELFGGFNFALSRSYDFYDHELLGFLLEFERHSLSHEWFLRTIENVGGVYDNLGFNFKGRDSWSVLARNNRINDIPTPRKGMMAGIINEFCIELLSETRTDEKHDEWRYSETILDASKWSTEKESMRQLFNRVASTIDYAMSNEKQEGYVKSGKEREIKVSNNADNRSVPYERNGIWDDADDVCPWKRDIGYGVWLVDLQGLKEFNSSAASILDWNSVTLDELKDFIGSQSDYFVRQVGFENISSPNSWFDDDVKFVLPGKENLSRVVKIDRFDNDIFDEDRPLIDDEGIYRSLLLVYGAGVKVNGDSLPIVDDCDIYKRDNIVITEGWAEPSELFSVISKTQTSGRNAVAMSMKALSQPPKHELSEYALSPNEVVTVSADSNGVWSVSLNSSESYSTVDEEAIIISRFELIDAGNEDGAARFQNNKTIYDMPYVTVSGTLPQTTDADGNPVCEGRCYTVQLTVMATDEEDAVTTCILDVRSPTDADDGEDEDEDDSDEPKSCDPNEMVGPEGLGSNRLVKPGEWMTYTIYFENKADAEAAAASVTVTNPLSDAFDWSTFEMLEVGFGSQVDIGLAGKSSGISECRMEGTNTFVRTEVALDADNGVASWYLRIVDPYGDADEWPLDIYAGFLPPNDETHRGEGHLTYRIKLRDDALDGVVVTNSASIIFDYNDPIETDPAWWNTVARTNPTIELKIDLSKTEKGKGAWGNVRLLTNSVPLEAAVSGSITTYTINGGAEVDLTFVPNDGFRIYGSQAGEGQFTTTTNYTFVAITNCSYSATFQPAPKTSFAWKYAKNKNGWFCAQIAFPGYEGYADAIENPRFLFADRTNDQNVRTSYLVDPSSVIDPLSTTETYQGVTYRKVALPVSAIAGKVNGARVVFGVSDATMASSVDSVPADERLMCLRVVNRNINSVALMDNVIGYLVWECCGDTYYQALGGTKSPGFISTKLLSIKSLNNAAAFGIDASVVEPETINCRFTSFSISGNRFVGTFEVVAESEEGTKAAVDEIASSVETLLLGAESPAGPFEPVGDAISDMEIDVDKAPFTFQGTLPSKYRFFRLNLSIDEIYK